MTLDQRIVDLYNQGLTYRQISAELRVTYATVIQRIYRMRKRGKDIPYRVQPDKNAGSVA